MSSEVEDFGTLSNFAPPSASSVRSESRVMEGAPLTIDATLLLLGGPAQADAGVLVGYRPGRTPKDPRLILGADAKLRAGTIIYGGSIIGARLETGHNVVIREDNAIGDDVKIWNNSTVDYGCRIGHRVKIHT